MKLSLQQWPHFLVRNMTVHTWSAAGVVTVVMVTVQTVLTFVSLVSKGHREYRVRAKPAILLYRLFTW